MFFKLATFFQNNFKKMWKTYLIIGLGGFLGSTSRFAMAQFMQRFFQTTFPIGTLSVNIIGSLVIGILYGISEYFNWLSPSMRMFLAVGFCGGFTTFSSFAYENISLLRDAQYFNFILYLSVSIIAGLFAAWSGFTLIRQLS